METLLWPTLPPSAPSLSSCNCWWWHSWVRAHSHQTCSSAFKEMLTSVMDNRENTPCEMQKPIKAINQASGLCPSISFDTWSHSSSLGCSQTFQGFPLWSLGWLPLLLKCCLQPKILWVGLLGSSGSITVKQCHYSPHIYININY